MLRKCESRARKSGSALVRSLITIFYSAERLAASSATLGHINSIIRDAVIGM